MFFALSNYLLCPNSILSSSLESFSRPTLLKFRILLTSWNWIWFVYFLVNHIEKLLFTIFTLYAIHPNICVITWIKVLHVILSYGCSYVQQIHKIIWQLKNSNMFWNVMSFVNAPHAFHFHWLDQGQINTDYIQHLLKHVV